MGLRRALSSLGTALLQPVNKAAIILLGIYTVLWGGWVASPFWDTFPTAHVYHVLAQVGPEWFWGGVSFFFGFIIIYGAVKRTYLALLTGSAVAGWHWFMIGIFYIMGDWQNTGGLTALILATYACYIWLNIRVNHHMNNRSMREIVK